MYEEGLDYWETTFCNTMRNSPRAETGLVPTSSTRDPVLKAENGQSGNSLAGRVGPECRKQVYTIMDLVAGAVISIS